MCPVVKRLFLNDSWGKDNQRAVYDSTVFKVTLLFLFCVQYLLLLIMSKQSKLKDCGVVHNGLNCIVKTLVISFYIM